MKALFDDILTRIPEKPSWYDSNGTPRYGAFNPDACPNIYASEVALVEIACQSCTERFLVEVHSDRHAEQHIHQGSVKGRFTRGSIGYGDPPRHDGDKCLAGDTMTPDALRVVEFWEKDAKDGWVRNFEVENRAFAAWTTCYGLAWTSYFGAMGNRTIRQFVSDASVNYLTNKMSVPKSKKRVAYLARIISAVKQRLSDQP